MSGMLPRRPRSQAALQSGEIFFSIRSPKKTAKKAVKKTTEAVVKEMLSLLRRRISLDWETTYQMLLDKFGGRNSVNRAAYTALFSKHVHTGTGTLIGITKEFFVDPFHGNLLPTPSRVRPKPPVKEKLKPVTFSRLPGGAIKLALQTSTGGVNCIVKAKPEKILTKEYGRATPWYREVTLPRGRSREAWEILIRKEIPWFGLDSYYLAPIVG